MKALMTKYHEAVFAIQAVDGLNVRPGGIYIDVTFGGGTHTSLILSELKGGRLFSFDRDPDVKLHLPVDSAFTFIPHNFRYLRNYLSFHGIEKIDGILADLGVSSHQIDEGARGFSIREDGPLDMRMDKKSLISAFNIINEYTKDQLVSIFRLYGDLRESNQIAAVIIKNREISPIQSTGDLVNILSHLSPPHHRSKFLSRVFQSIRMEVNQEIDDLKILLEDGTHLLNPGGRFVVISYHSGEDRLVKNYFACGNFDGIVQQDFYGNVVRPLDPMTRKPIVPSLIEQEQNPRSRSAKLRIAEKRNKLS
jgi:16S rRNA (cytosine1402-N4)-methyltransferase